VEEFNGRFDKVVQKVGADVMDVGKAAGYTWALLPIIKQFAVLGNQETLEESKESARRAEISAFGFARQLIPEQTSLTNTNRIYQDMKTEKKDDAMDELMKKFKEMEVKLLNQTGTNNRGNYQRNYSRNYQGNYQENNNNRRRNYDNLVCFECNQTGHIRPDCPEIGNNRNNRGPSGRENN